MFFKLGKNLLWLELHLMSEAETGQLNMQVNLSQNLTAAAEVAVFQPNYVQLQSGQADVQVVEEGPTKETAAREEAADKRGDQISIGKKVNPLAAEDLVKLNLADPLKTHPRDYEVSPDIDVQDEEQIKFMES